MGSAPKSGFAALGRAIGGGDAYATMAAQEETDRLAGLYEKQMAGAKAAEETTRLHSTNEARGRMVPIVQGAVDSGDLPPNTNVQATADSLLAMDKLDPSNLGDFYAKTTNLYRGNQAIQSFGVHDPDTANANLAAISGRPMETTKIEGGIALNPYTSPDQPMSITPVGQADIGEKNAQAAHGLAGAFLDRMRAGMESTKAPTIQSFYDPKSGQEYKGQWNRAEQRWEPVGGMKASSEPLVLTQSPDDPNKYIYTPRSEAPGLPGRPPRGSGGGLTAAQQANNQEIQAARDAMRGLGASREEIQRRSQQKDQRGRPNPDYDPYIGRVIGKALQRKTGDDPEYNSVYSQFYTGDLGEESQPRSVTTGAPINPAEPTAQPAAASARPPGFSDVQLYNMARDKLGKGTDPVALAGRLRQWGLDPSKVQGLQ